MKWQKNIFFKYRDCDFWLLRGGGGWFFLLASDCESPALYRQRWDNFRYCTQCVHNLQTFRFSTQRVENVWIHRMKIGCLFEINSLRRQQGAGLSMSAMATQIGGSGCGTSWCWCRRRWGLRRWGWPLTPPLQFPSGRIVCHPLVLSCCLPVTCSYIVPASFWLFQGYWTDCPSWLTAWRVRRL